MSVTTGEVSSGRCSGRVTGYTSITAFDLRFSGIYRSVADDTSATGASANRGLTWLETPFNTRDSPEKQTSALGQRVYSKATPEGRIFTPCTGWSTATKSPLAVQVGRFAIPAGTSRAPRESFAPIVASCAGANANVEARLAREIRPAKPDSAPAVQWPARN